MIWSLSSLSKPARQHRLRGSLWVALALWMLVLLSPSLPAQAQRLQLHPINNPSTVVEAGAFRLVATVGGSTVEGSTAGPTLSLLQAHYRSAQASAQGLESASVPEAYALSSNYPNPFNPETTIPFAVPEASEVTIAVYDLLGREVAVLVEGEMAAGRHEVQFRANGLPSGMYLVRMQAGSFSQVRRMTLVK